MAGFRVLDPAGEGWEYSLDGQNWQTDPLFTQQSPGVPLVLGMIYLVYCRHDAESKFTFVVKQLGTPTSVDDLTMQALAGRGISGIAAQLIYQAIAGLIPPVVIPPVAYPGLYTVTHVDHTTDLTLEMGGLSLPMFEPNYEAAYPCMLVQIDGRLHARPMDFSRLSEYMIDRMPAPWKAILVEKLYPSIKQKLMDDGCLSCGDNNGPTLSYIRILGGTDLNEGGTLQLIGQATYSDGSKGPIPNGIWTITGSGVSIDQTGLASASTNTTPGDSRPATVQLNWNGKEYARGIYIIDTTVVSTVNDVPDGHFVEVAMSTPFLYPGGFDSNDCEKITGWGRNKANPDTPAVTIIKRDGVEIARRTSSGYRPDVKTYLNDHGVPVNYEYFGIEYIKTADDKDGQPHTYSLWSEDGTTEYEVNVEKTITCAAPPSGPYPTGAYRIVTADNNFVLNEGGAARAFTLKQALNDGTERDYPGNDVAWGIASVVTSNNSTAATVILSLAADSIPNDLYLTLLASPPNIKAEHGVQLVNTGPAACTRPTGLTTGQLIYNYAPTGQNATTFNTLDDANSILGAHFAGATSGQYGSGIAQWANLNVGTRVYYSNGTDCATVSDNIYYVTDSNGANTVKVAIQVVNGVIVAVKASTYTARPPGSEGCTNYGKIAPGTYDALPVIQIQEYKMDTANAYGAYRRAFASEAEATANVRIIGQASSRAQFDLVRVSTADVKVNDTLFGNNNPPDGDSFHWPAEAGYWGYDVHFATDGSTPWSYVLLRTNACGQIIERRQIYFVTA